jgi:hypothetical protein
MLVASFFSTEALADKWEVFLPVGLTLGYGFNPKRLDFGADANRFSFGPEVGIGPFGIDGGAVISTLDGTHGGVTGRFLLTVGVLALYGRVGGIFDSPQEGTFGEIGLLIKAPIPIFGARIFDPPLPPPPPAPPDGPLQQDPPKKEEEKPSLPVAT